jgi:hypothetical protein
MQKEVEMVNLVEVFAKRVVGIDREIGGDDGESRARVNLRLEEIRDNTPPVIVPDLRTGRRIWHGLVA